MKRRLMTLVACLAALAMIAPSAAYAQENDVNSTVEIVIERDGESSSLILRKKIHGVKITMIPNNGGYPVMYRYISRY